MCASAGRRQRQILRGEIEICVRLGEQRRDFARERPSAVQHDELGLAQIGIVKRGFEIHRIAAAHVEVTARAGVGVNVYGHPETSAFHRDIAEEKILQRLIRGLIERHWA